MARGDINYINSPARGLDKFQFDRKKLRAHPGCPVRGANSVHIMVQFSPVAEDENR